MAISNLVKGESFKLTEDFPFYDFGMSELIYLGEHSSFGRNFLVGKHYLFGGKSKKFPLGIVLGIPRRNQQISKEEIDFSQYTFLSLIPKEDPSTNELESLLSGEEND